MPFQALLIASVLSVLVDEAFVLVAPRFSENALSSAVIAGGRAGAALLVLAALPIAAVHSLATARARSTERLGLADAVAWVALVADRIAGSDGHRPWLPGRLDASREALVQAASTVWQGVPVGGLVAWTLTAGLVFAAAHAFRATFSRIPSAIAGTVTLLFVGGATLVYASGAGEAWLERPVARTSAPCPPPQRSPEPPKEIENGSEKRDPK